MTRDGHRNDYKLHTYGCSISKCIICSILFCLALVSLDCINCVSIIKQKLGAQLFTIFVVSLSIIIFILFLKLRKEMWNLFKSQSPNLIDSCIKVLVMAIPMYVLCAFIIGTMSLYKIVISSVLFVCCLIACILKFIRIIRSSPNKRQNSLIDLKDIFNNVIDRNIEGPLVVSEKAVNYDLLERGVIINVLYNSIIRCMSEESFVIGLEGEWGSGKTTIFKNVQNIIAQEEKHYTIIDDFDPWTYSSEKAMLSALFDSILVCSGMTITRSIRNSIADICNVISDNYVPGGITKALLRLTHNNETEAIKCLKEKMRSFLMANGKHIVVFIDNIDRADSKNIVFLMKVISVVFNIPNMVFVMAYGKKRLNEIMSESLSINPQYSEKIINQVITIPEVQSKRMQYVCAVCVDNLLSYYNATKNAIIELQPAKIYICERVTNLRQFKRLINSVFSTVFLYDTGLNPFDLLSIQLILFEETEVYRAIYENKEFFISDDRVADIDVFSSQLIEKTFNENGKIFFDRLTETASKECMVLLGEMFPFVSRYLKKQDLIERFSVPTQKRARAISSAKFFELYFSYSSNVFLRISQSVEDCIKEINESDTVYTIKDIIDKYLANLSPDNQREWFEQFNLRSKEIDCKRVFDCVKTLYLSVNSINSTGTFGFLSARELCISVIADLLFRCKFEDVSQFFDSIANDSNKLLVIRKICYWLKSNCDKNRRGAEEIINLANNTHRKLISRIINDKVDLYSDENYTSKNVYGLFDNDEELRIKDLKEYISEIATKDNIIRIIGDVVVESKGNTYTYFIDDETFKEFFDDKSTVDRLLEECHPKSDKEKFIVSVYENYKNGQPDEFGQRGLVTNQPMDCQL